MANKLTQDYAVFILTHGRADDVVTYKTLRRQGYTGRIYLLVDTDDDQIGLYQEKYGDEVILFNKGEVAKTFDIGDNFHNKAAVVYARNACFTSAKDLGYEYFMEFDDDYTEFDYRLYKYGKPKPVKNLDVIFRLMVDYFKSIPASDLAMAQGGDFIGGAGNSYAQEPTLTRKCMNTHILSTKRQFNFLGTMNEDVNTPLVLGQVGKLFFTFPLLSVTQSTTQSKSGGLTDLYLDRGTYVKSFYSVMYTPSCVKVAPMGDKHYRLHHRVAWNNAIPKIISEDLRK